MSLGDWEGWDTSPKELIGESGARDGYGCGQLACKEPAHHSGGDVQNAVGSIALDRVQGYRLRHRLHLGWSSCCWKGIKPAKGWI